MRAVSISSTLAASPTIPTSTGMIFPISVSSMSIWMTFACLAYSETLPVTLSSKRIPTATRTSQRWVIMLAAMLPCIPAIPR